MSALASGQSIYLRAIWNYQKSKNIMSIYLTVNIIIISSLFMELLFKKVLYNDKKTGEITDKW